MREIIEINLNYLPYWLNKLICGAMPTCKLWNYDATNDAYFWRNTNYYVPNEVRCYWVNGS